VNELEREMDGIGEQAIALWIRDTAVVASMFRVSQGQPDGVVVDIRPALEQCGINVAAIPEADFTLRYRFVDCGEGFWMDETTGNGGDFVSLLHGLASAFLGQFGDLLDFDIA